MNSSTWLFQARSWHSRTLHFTHQVNLFLLYDLQNKTTPTAWSLLWRQSLSHMSLKTACDSITMHLNCLWLNHYASTRFDTLNVVTVFSSSNNGKDDTRILSCTASFSHSPPNINIQTYVPLLYISCSVCFFCCITTKPYISQWLTFCPAYLKQKDTRSMSGNLHEWSFLQVPTLHKSSVSHHAPSFLSPSVTWIHLNFITAAPHTVMRRITMFRSTTDRMYDSGLIML